MLIEQSQISNAYRVYGHRDSGLGNYKYQQTINYLHSFFILKLIGTDASFFFFFCEAGSSETLLEFR